MTTVREIMAREGITVETTGEGFHRDAAGWEHHRFGIMVGRDRAPVTYRQGMGIDHDPDPADVLASLAMDARVGEASFSDYCADFGEDEDSRRAYATWEDCGRVLSWLERVLGRGVVEELWDAGDES